MSGLVVLYGSISGPAVLYPPRSVPEREGGRLHVKTRNIGPSNQVRIGWWDSPLLATLPLPPSAGFFWVFLGTALGFFSGSVFLFR